MRRVSSGAFYALLIVAALVCSATASLLPRAHELTPHYTYREYLAHTGKVRPAGELTMREELFQAELAAVLRHNAKAGQLYRQGLNKYSDWTVEEKATLVMGIGRTALTQASDRDAGSLDAASIERAKVAAARDTPAASPQRKSLDYRRASPPVLTAVKDQGQCGSCWSFSTTETIESHNMIQNEVLPVLSMQQMVSCAPGVNITIVDFPVNQSNPAGKRVNVTQAMGGCGGYMPSFALDYVAKEQGGYMTQEWEVPYQSYWAQVAPNLPQYRPTPPCMNNATREMNGVNVTGYVQNPANDAGALEDVLFDKGPVITVMYIPQSFFAYEGGVYASSECDGNNFMVPSHAVQIVGYGHDDGLGVGYWIVRNSWSPYWGDKGFFRLLRSDPSICGEMWLPSDANDKLMVQRKACSTCGILGWTVYPTMGTTPKSPI